MRIYIILIFLLLVSNNSFAQTSNSLLVDYNFNDDTSDSSGNEYHATLFGGSFVSDRFGNESSALYFDGIDDYIELPNLVELKPDLPLSFSFWIKYDSNSISDREVFNTSFEDDRNTGVFFNAQSSTGKFAVNYGDGSYSYLSSTRRSYVTNAQIEIDTWYHIAVVIESEVNMKIFVDCVNNGGVHSGSGGALVYSDLAGGIGRHDRNLSGLASYFKGTIDDFKYWSRQLTIEEINDLCNSLDIVEQAPVEKSFLRIYPNPSENGIFNIKTNSNNFSIVKAFDISGKLVYNDKFNSTIDLSNLTSGMYFLNIQGLGESETRKVIIK